MEVSPGVFIGHVSQRIRQKLWSRTIDLCQDGRALLVYSKKCEQRLAFEVHRHDWETVDFDGLTLLRRPNTGTENENPLRSGWSNAARRRRFGRR